MNPPSPTPTHLKVRVVQQAVSEDGKTYLKNQVLYVTPSRFAQLGDFVTVVSDPASTPSPVPVAATTAPAAPAALAPVAVPNTPVPSAPAASTPPAK